MDGQSTPAASGAADLVELPPGRHGTSRAGPQQEFRIKPRIGEEQPQDSDSEPVVHGLQLDQFFFNAQQQRKITAPQNISQKTSATARETEHILTKSPGKKIQSGKTKNKQR